MRIVNNIGVFAASSSKVRQHFLDEAYHLGCLFAQNGKTLVYGAGHVGLMGSIADGVDSAGGRVIGVIPGFMVEQGWCRSHLTKRIVTADMHERKATIHQLSDAFVALPGGIGTWEELLECMTWKQLGLHDKPIILLNIDGFYNRLIDDIRFLADEQMMRDVHLSMFTVVNNAEDVLPAIENAPLWDVNIRKIAQI